MQQLLEVSNENLLNFVKEHLPQTPWFKKVGVHLFDEKRYLSLQRWELLEFVNLIGQELGLYFKKTSIPSLQISSSSSEV